MTVCQIVNVWTRRATCHRETFFCIICSNIIKSRLKQVFEVFQECLYFCNSVIFWAISHREIIFCIITSSIIILRQKLGFGEKLQNYKHSCKTSKSSFSFSTSLFELKIQEKISVWEVALQNYKITKFLPKLQSQFQYQYNYVWTNNAEQNNHVRGSSTKLQNYKNSSKTSKSSFIFIITMLELILQKESPCEWSLYKITKFQTFLQNFRNQIQFKFYYV